MFPSRDQNPQFYTLVTISFIVLNALARALVQGMGAECQRLARLQLT